MFSSVLDNSRYICCSILFLLWSYRDCSIFDWQRKCSPAFLVIPVALFDSFASLKLKRLQYSLLAEEIFSVHGTSSYVVRIFCFHEVEKIVAFLTERKMLSSVLDNSSYVLSFFCFLEVERTCSPAFLIIPATFFRSFASLELKGLYYPWLTEKMFSRGIVLKRSW